MAANTKKRKDFIDTLMSMTDTELNDFIKAKGKPPKKVVMCRIVDASKKGIIVDGGAA